jgi:hypothetical protein
MALLPGKFVRAAMRRWFGPLARTHGIVKVTVRDHDFRIIRVIASEEDLAAFRGQWSAMIEADRRSWTPPPQRQHYTLDIQWIGRYGRIKTARWFYFLGGFLHMLAIWRAIWVAPLYRTPSPAAFEAMLGVDPL